MNERAAFNKHKANKWASIYKLFILVCFSNEKNVVYKTEVDQEKQKKKIEEANTMNWLASVSVEKNMNFFPFFPLKNLLNLIEKFVETFSSTCHSALAQAKK